VRLFLFELSYIQKLDHKNSVYIELLPPIVMELEDLTFKLKMLIIKQDRNESYDELYFGIKDLIELIE
jgi:hypothetical protein